MTTGTEPALLLVGRFLAPQAGRVAASLTRNATYRWRICRSVGRRLDFAFPRRAYRSWLRTITQADLEQPVETGGAALADRLCHYLDERQPSWRERPYRLSESLRLVEATFVAIVTAADEGAGHALSEQWARQRNDEMIAQVLELRTGYGPVHDSDLAVWLLRRSNERRSIRLAAFDIDGSSIQSALDSVADQLPTVAPGAFRALVGSFGSGKSEMAESWHRNCVSRLLSGDATQLPVWLYARQLVGHSLEHTVQEQVGAAAFRTRGVAVVVDGLDEVDGVVAEGIALDARVMVASNHLCAVLATCRDGVLRSSDDDIAAPGLPDEAARSLVQELSGSGHATWDWSAELVETIKRPYFALAAGTMLSTGAVPTGEVGMTAKLVERALGQAKDWETTQSGDKYDSLVKLGVSLTRTLGRSDGLTYRERQVALATRLVTERSEGLLAFSLPVFEQWFAAQAVRSDPRLQDEALADETAFDRWRWAVAIAILGGTPDEADALIERCLGLNPGAGAWVTQQVSFKGDIWSTSDVQQLDPGAAASRLVRATRGWISSLGPLARVFFPVADDQEPFHLGVRTKGNVFDVGWLREPVESDGASALPVNVHMVGPRDEHWWLESSGNRAHGEVWPWTKVRNDIASGMLGLLDGPEVLGRTDGPWHREQRYALARTIMNSRTVFHTPMKRQAIIDMCEKVADQVPDVASSDVRMNGRTFRGAALVDLLTWLRSQTFEHFDRPVPAPDLGFPPSGLVWDFYSPARMVRFCADMLGQACDIYEEMAATMFARFDWSLGRSAFGPFGSIGSVEFGDNRMGPGLNHTELPMELVADYIAQYPDAVVSANGRAAIRLETEGRSETWSLEWMRSADELQDWIARKQLAGPFTHIGSSSSNINCNHERPASLQAATWMWDDMKRLSLGSGTFPQLSR